MPITTPSPASSSLRALDEPGGPPLLRDLRRLWRLTAIAWVYWTRGGRLRRAYRRARARGETLWLDDGPTGAPRRR